MLFGNRGVRLPAWARLRHPDDSEHDRLGTGSKGAGGRVRLWHVQLGARRRTSEPNSLPKTSFGSWTLCQCVRARHHLLRQRQHLVRVLGADKNLCTSGINHASPDQLSDSFFSHGPPTLFLQHDDRRAFRDAVEGFVTSRVAIRSEQRAEGNRREMKKAFL